MIGRLQIWQLGIGVLACVLAAVFLIRGIRNLVTTRGAVTTYSRLIAGANAGDVGAVRALCSERYRTTHPPEAAREGGMIGFPRQIHPNFQVWVQGREVWLCAANRVGTVHRFVWEADRWKYDGPMGFLRADGVIVPMRVDQPQPAKIP